ncbi:MAG: YfiR family protein [Myxococcota bacterium]
MPQPSRPKRSSSAIALRRISVWARAIVCPAVMLLSLVLPAQHANAATANEIKAVMLLGFAQLSEWPESDSDSGPFRICLFGESEMGPALRAAVDGERALDRPIRVREIDSLDHAGRCSILFVAEAGRAEFADAMTNLTAPHTLLVGDFSGFAKNAGAIEFFSDSGRVRFAVNVEHVEDRGIRLSSRILSRARIVEAD